MMTRTQREIAFFVFLLILMISVVMQIKLINEITNGNGDIYKSFIPLISNASCILTSVGIFFLIIKKEFLEKKELGNGDLKKFFIDRTMSLETKDCLASTSQLILNSLRFTEKMLKKEFGNDLNFEISVFFKYKTT